MSASNAEMIEVLESVALSAALGKQSFAAVPENPGFDQKVRTIWKNIANGKNEHGTFLRAFGQAVSAADELNFVAMMPTAIYLIAKYDLDKPEYREEEGL